MKLDLDIFQIDSNGLSPDKGRALIAEPILPDKIFSRSVILIVDDTDNEHFGVILNKESGVLLGSVLGDFEDTNFKLFVGGPVNTESVHYVHRYGDAIPGSVHIKGDLWWNGDYDAVLDLLHAGILENSKIRFFLGYSGWGKGQLQEELDDSAWLVCNTPDNFISSDHKELWKRSLTYVDKKYEIWKNFPENPELN